MNHKNNRLYPEDQARVDQFIRSGVNAVSRQPIRPLRLMGWLLVIIVALGVLSRVIGQFVPV